MADRYTSPALSRDLAAAGLEQDRGARVPCWTGGDKLLEFPHCCFGNEHAHYYHVRALDLADVLHEIEKRGATWLVETDGGTYCATAVLNPKFSAVMGGPSAVEAAGLCLLALMDKEREAKP